MRISNPIKSVCESWQKLLLCRQHFFQPYYPLQKVSCQSATFDKDELKSKEEPQDHEEVQLSKAGCYTKRVVYRNEMSRAASIMAWDVHRELLVAHTGNAWKGSLVFADALRVLISWPWCSLRVANMCCFSSALLYGLLYKVFVRMLGDEPLLPMQNGMASFHH